MSRIAELSNVEMEFGRLSVFNPLPLKVFGNIEVTPLGIVILDNKVIPAKALEPIEFKFDGKRILDKCESPSKAPAPIEVIESGRTILVSAQSWAKALSGIELMESVRVIDDKFAAKAKEVEPIDFTEVGTTTSVIPILFVKALSPMEDALESIVTFPMHEDAFVTTPFMIE